jgi:hypothetical protein
MVFSTIPEQHWIDLREHLGFPFRLAHLKNQYSEHHARIPSWNSCIRKLKNDCAYREHEQRVIDRFGWVNRVLFNNLQN